MKIIAAISILLFLGGCATIPDVTYRYYPAQFTITVKVIQTLGCNDDKTALVVSNVPSVAPEYSSNIHGKLMEIRLKDLRSITADSDMKMNFTEDGRLKSINQSTTGQGESIIKSAVVLGTALAPFMAAAPVKQPPIVAACTAIDQSGKGKPVTLTYEKKISSEKELVDLELDSSSLTAESKNLYLKIKNVLPRIKVAVAMTNDGSGAICNECSSENNVVKLALQKVGLAEFRFQYCEAGDDNFKDFGKFNIVVPEDGEVYCLPIPRPALFGKQEFSLELSNAGAITAVGYTSNAGTATAGVLNSLGAIANTQTPAAKAQQLKEENDLIAQEQRRILCTTKPAQCK